jgi:predicted GNAT family acetyltransferase
VAMAGQRLHPNPFIEISAVCTHPDHTGKGYAATLINDQIRRILAGSETPFLHVLEENEHAIKLYQKLGFVIREQVIGYGLQKQVDPLVSST